MSKITANGIMLGNIVTVDNPKYHPKLKNVPLRVTGIQERTINGKVECSVNLEHINQEPNHYYDVYSQFMEFINPIPLSEDILLRCGAVKISEKLYRFRHAFLVHETSTCFAVRLEFEEGGFWNVLPFSKLHQLQNLYRLCMNQDLIVKL